MSNDSFKYTPDDPTARRRPVAKPRPAHHAQDAAARAQVPWGPFGAIVFSLLLYLTAQLLGSLLVMVYPYLRGWDKATGNEWLDNSVAAQFWFVLSAEAITFGAIWQFIRMKGARLRTIGWRWLRWRDLLYTLGGFVAYFVAYMILIAVVKQLVPDLNVNQKQQIGFGHVAGSSAMLMTFTSLVILPPLVEETMFRGFVFTGLRSKLKPVGAALLTSVLFASLHLQFGSGKPLLWVAALDTFTLSMVACYLRHKTDSLWPGIFLHMLKNGIAFVSLFIMSAY